MKVLVISPSYNERENIANLIDSIFSLSIPLDLLIIDDSSPDGTADIVRSMLDSNPRLHMIERENKQGLGTAYCRGFRYAMENNYDIVVQIDADLSHDPKDIERFIKLIDKYDLIIGSRYSNGVNVINWPMSRLLLSYYANCYARFLTRVPIMDITGGFKCIRIDALQAIDLDKIKSQGYSFQIEINFLIYNKGFRVTEMPIIFTDRVVGHSKMNKNIIYEAILIVPRLFLKKMFRKL